LIIDNLFHFLLLFLFYFWI